MKKHLLRQLFVFLTCLFPLFGMVTSTARAADPPQTNGYKPGGEWTTASGCVGSSSYGAESVPTIKGLECLVANVLATAITLLGIVAFIMFLVGGFQYLTAGNNSKAVEQGQNSIAFAILGIVLALSSIIIVNIISRLTGISTILTFQVLQLK